MSVKYGIQVPFDGTELWVMEDSGKAFPDNLKVMLFDSYEAAKTVARAYETYSIKEYYDIEDFDWENLANNQKA